MKRISTRLTLRDRRIEAFTREIRRAEAALATIRLIVDRTANPTPERLDALHTAERAVAALRTQLDATLNADARQLIEGMAENVIGLARALRAEDRKTVAEVMK